MTSKMNLLCETYSKRCLESRVKYPVLGHIQEDSLFSCFERLAAVVLLQLEG